MRKTLMGLAAVSVLAVTLAVPATAGTKDQKGTAVADCINSVTNQKEGTFTYDGVLVAWPPNHKYREATVTLTDDDAEPLTDKVTVAVTGSHNQIGENGKELVGSGHTDSTTDTLPGAGSGDGSASAVFFFRGERSGTEQAGRTYEFTATGTTDNGTAECKPVKFTAYVPHDQGN